MSRISPVRTAWTMTLVYLFIMVIMWIFIAIAHMGGARFEPEGFAPMPVAAVGLVSLIVYGIGSFIFGLIFAWFYNLVALWTKGIEFDLKEVEKDK